MQTLFTNSDTQNGTPMRIDRQTVGIQIPSNGQTYTYQLYAGKVTSLQFHLFYSPFENQNALRQYAAVQIGSDTLASVRIPVGYRIGTRRIRNAVLESQRRLGTTTIGVPNDAPTTGGTAAAVQYLTWFIIGPKIQM